MDIGIYTYMNNPYVGKLYNLSLADSPASVVHESRYTI